jgi:DNA topoisomerase-1
MNAVVIVESPAKAKTINKYLGKDYQVLASYGHVRDLPAKDGSVRPDEEFAMSWTVDAKADKRLKEIARAVKGAERLYLATDPDREGEAISWHIAEELKRRRALAGVTVKRVVFNEVTKSAVVQAFKQPRELNGELIEAYLARRALDYLVGFSLSPVLWRKLPGSRSAGRVQSVALRLICEREAEIEVFRPREYWTIDVALRNPDDAAFSARLTHLEGRKLDRYDLADQTAAEAAARRLRAAASFAVEAVERKQTRRNPFAPFTTSTLQQEASRKLGFGTTRTMRLAQQLYEGIDLGGETVGLITYMRTDGVQISNEALGTVREVIFQNFGDPYLPDAPRLYKTKAKNAQEAHEAIRPTDPGRLPKDVAGRLAPDALKLYELIWKRTIASQMESARLEQVAVDIAVDGQAAKLRANGQIVLFDGFLRLYQESRDEPKDGAEGDGARLPKLNQGDLLTRDAVTPEQHFTQPPPRFTEASLVKRLEELGIGRPSTYASIIQVLQDRDYVVLDKRRFVPQDRGRLVTAFLTSFFQRYVEYGFTAALEEQLDDISGGRVAWKDVLAQFWSAFHQAIEETKGLRIAEVIDALDEDLGPHFFAPDPEAPDSDPRLCPSCKTGRLGLRIAKNGGFIGCSGYPECRYTRPLAVVGANGAEGQALYTEPKLLGQDPANGEAVTLRKGPFGFYAQLGEGADGEKPKRVSLPRHMAPDQLALAEALALLALPREIGRHPEGNEPIIVGIGRYGPYIKHGKRYCSLKGDDDVLSIGLNRAVTVLAETPQRGGANAGTPIGEHPSDGQPVTLHSGRYGPYVKHGRLIASLPKGTAMEAANLEMAIGLLAERAAKAKPAKQTKAKAKPAKKTKAKAGAKAKPGAKAKAGAKAKTGAKAKAGGAKAKTGAKKRATGKAAAS